MLTQIPWRQLSARQWLGVILIVVSCLGWTLLTIVPFLPMEGARKMHWAGGLFLFAEVTWWCAMPLLGPEVLALLKLWWQRLKNWIRGLDSDEGDH
jgi:hypothetical protein